MGFDLCWTEWSSLQVLWFPVTVQRHAHCINWRIYRVVFLAFAFCALETPAPQNQRKMCTTLPNTYAEAGMMWLWPITQPLFLSGHRCGWIQMGHLITSLHLFLFLCSDPSFPPLRSYPFKTSHSASLHCHVKSWKLNQAAIKCLHVGA